MDNQDDYIIFQQMFDNFITELINTRETLGKYNLL